MEFPSPDVELVDDDVDVFEMGVGDDVTSVVVVVAVGVVVVTVALVVVSVAVVYSPGGR